jgi:uncharacterized membrane protein
MTMLVLGLLLFLGVHSVRIVAEGWRTATIARLGEKGWKGLYSLASVLGLVLIVVGYGAARAQPVLVWVPPIWTRHLAGLLNLVAIVLLVAAYVPGNRIKAALRHPMILGIKVWAFAHLVSNQMLADFVLFGAFFVWAVLDFRAARGRDRAAGVAGAAGAAASRGRMGPTIVAVVAGVALWALIAFWAHGVVIGVKPFGG